MVSDDAETKAELFRVKTTSLIQWLWAWTWCLKVVVPAGFEAEELVYEDEDRAGKSRFQEQITPSRPAEYLDNGTLVSGGPGREKAPRQRGLQDRIVGIYRKSIDTETMAARSVGEREHCARASVSDRYKGFHLTESCIARRPCWQRQNKTEDD